MMDKMQIDEMFGDSQDVPMEEVREMVAAIPPPEVIPYTKGGMRYQLVSEGVCSSCAHCGQALTDGESVERGLGPVCSKKGYFEEVEPRDSTEAMLALAEYPKLVDYLVSKYKDKGNRGLVNGLTRTASLNRRTPVHAACTDAIDALGYKKLASLLRESLASVEIYELPENPDCYGVWVKKCDFNYSFARSLGYLPGASFRKKPTRAWIVPKTHRRAIAELMIQHYTGLFIKTPKGSHRISPEWIKSR